MLKSSMPSLLSLEGVTTVICGFGPISSGIRTSQMLAVTQPNQCLLIGIAGSMHPDLKIGSAYEFNQVACYGIGVGSGSAFVAASELGWRQWPVPHDGLLHSDASCCDILRLKETPPSMNDLQLLTVCAASASEQDVQQRLRLFSNAMAEDMEGFSVALACQTANIPLTIIRGISNIAGDRDKSRWKIQVALDATAKRALSYLKSSVSDVTKT